MFGKMMVRVLLAAALVASAVTVQASVFSLPNGETSLQFVPVGDTGNVADTTGLGAVSYAYSIGACDVTAAQYAAFLNAVAVKSDPYGLYNLSMGSVGGDPYGGGGGCGITQTSVSGSYTYSVATAYQNFPVNYVSWGDAARFCNWLQNGQPTGGTEGTGTTETGSYTLNGANTDAAFATVTRNPGATYYLPTENEWYKAAYYSGGGTSSTYWQYPTQSNSAPSNVLSPTGTNNANFLFTDSNLDLTSVGAFAASPSHYGTFDQGGDVYQWTDGWFTDAYDDTGFAVVGSSFGDESSALRSNNAIYAWSPTESQYSFIGFRVVAVPEPSTLCLLAAALALLGGKFMIRRRQRP